MIAVILRLKTGTDFNIVIPYFSFIPLATKPPRHEENLRNAKSKKLSKNLIFVS
jgi:hypothetical protein